MATKTLENGNATPVESAKKPIEFVWLILFSNIEPPTICKPQTSPKEYLSIELVSSGSPYDTMYAYNFDRKKGCTYFGHWNDGIV